ncbi:MAG: DinB family protein [Acidobacteriota bacterium]
MTTTKTILLGQLAAAYDKNGWFSCLKYCLKGLTPEQAAWKPEGADNSIYEIINHLNYYNNAYLERFRGHDHESSLADNDETFDHSEAESWEAEVARFETIMDGWRAEMEKAGEAKFDELAPPGNESKWKAVISNIIAHAAHHGGQIVILRKLQGSWDSSGDVS